MRSRSSCAFVLESSGSRTSTSSAVIRLRNLAATPGSTWGTIRLAFLTVQRRTRSRAVITPPTSTIIGSHHSNRLNPVLVGASRTHSPYFDTKKSLISCGDLPACTCSRTLALICCAISEGESATERFWQTTHRNSAEMARVCSSMSPTGAAWTEPLKRIIEIQMIRRVIVLPYGLTFAFSLCSAEDTLLCLDDFFRHHGGADTADVLIGDPPLRI